MSDDVKCKQTVSMGIITGDTHSLRCRANRVACHETKCVSDGRYIPAMGEKSKK